MVKLGELWLNDNEFTSLSPAMFKIPGGQLSYLHMTSNPYENELDNYEDLDQMEA